MRKWKVVTMPLAALAVATALPLSGCHSDDDDDGTAVQSYTQVERLGRPAINEGLFFTNDFLNAVNSITPAQDAGALVGAIAAEAIAVLDALDLLDASDDLTATTALGAFIPDVMRIDTTITEATVTAQGSSYDVALNAVGSPVGGRMITDDVIDITLDYLITGNPAAGTQSDGVSYAGAGHPGQPGHQAVLAAFPYVPRPN